VLAAVLALIVLPKPKSVSPQLPSATSSSTPQADNSYDPHWANANYAVCMRQHGVPVKGPDSYGDLGFSGGGIDRQTFITAQRACESLWPPSKGFSIDEIIRAQDYRNKFNACVREHGGSISGPSSVPDPSPAQQLCMGQLGPAPEVNGPHP
jgi:hypothetical protein